TVLPGSELSVELNRVVRSVLQSARFVVNCGSFKSKVALWRSKALCIEAVDGLPVVGSMEA
ncbi:MAG: hypothetical protein O2780_12610, partial [Proteobacteria bacterium]|nr:hypothetical protein [Pseudomonadota bacterium]